MDWGELRKTIYKKTGRYLKMDADRNDATQAVLIKLLERDVKDLGRYSNKVIKLVCLDMIRASGKSPPTPIECLNMSPGTARVLLGKTWDILPHQHQEFLYMKFLTPMKDLEIANYLGVPLHTVKNRMTWIRKRLNQ